MELVNAFKKGDWLTRSSAIVMGLGNILRKQFIKGILFLFTEAAFLFFMAAYGWQCLLALPGLGEKEQGEVWNETLGVYEYVQGDNSLLILLYGIAVLFICAAFICVWAGAVKSAYQAQVCIEKNKPVTTFAEDIKSLFDKNLHKLLLTLPVGGILIFTILPLIFMIAMAFTNYSKVDSHLVLFDWVGLENFRQMFDVSGTLGKTFWSVLGWTIVWAVFATFLNYLLGVILAMLINKKGIRFKAFYRTLFVLAIAVPQFVSLLVMKNVLAEAGPMNVLLQELGWISSPLPFFTDPTWARVTVIIVDLWIGIPYTMLIVSGILMNIPEDL